MLITLSVFFCVRVSAQQVYSSQKDSVSSKSKSVLTDTLYSLLKNNAVTSVKSLNPLQFKSKFDSIKIKKDTAILSSYRINNILQIPLFDKKIRLTGGYNNYTFIYRGYIDTPISQSAVRQHYANGYFGVSFFGLPLSVSYLINRSNATLFRDINDVRVEFNAAAFTETVSKQYSGLIKNYISRFEDSLQRLTHLTKPVIYKYTALRDYLNSPMTAQLIQEYKQVLSLPELSYKVENTDSLNKITNDSLTKAARQFFTYYDAVKAESEQLKRVHDSIMQIYTTLISKIAVVKKCITGATDKGQLANTVKEILQEAGEETGVLRKYEKLLNIRQFAIGRNRLDYSELTGKNINIKGVNFEYNSSHIYLAFAAGGIDYRYRDFGLVSFNPLHQFMFMARVGKGRPENSHFYLTAYKGRKQLTRSANFTSTDGLATITGISTEVKYVIQEHTSIIAEAAQSIAPDYRTNPITKGKLQFDDKNSQAFAISLKSYHPKTNTSVEAMYKYTGANFQSFSSFVTTNSFTAWQAKLDQNFFKRKLRITASLRQNIFSNPYIQQLYDGRVVFKSIQLTYKSRRMPVITAGYMPVSQLIKLDNRLFETQFNSLTTSISHQYRLNSARLASSFMMYRFYNTAADTGFAYYNALNIFFNQLFTFSRFSLNAGVNHMVNRDYELSVLSGGIELPLPAQSNISFGFKVNNFNRVISKTSTYGTLQLSIKKLGILTATYETGYLPGINRQFIKNDQMIFSFTQIF